MNKVFVYLQCELPTLQSFFWAVLSGIVGTLLLTAFLSNIMSLELLSILFPAISGFNAAISGFMVMERTTDQVKRKKTMSAASGITVAVLSTSAINVIYAKLFGFFPVTIALATITAAIGIVCGLCGGVLSIKQKALHEDV